MTARSIDHSRSLDDARDPAPEITVWLPAERISIPIARSVVRRVVIFRDHDAESSFLIALTEVMANAIDEHVRSGVSSDVILLVVGGAGASVSVRDHGSGIDSELALESPAVVSHTSESGRGITLARAFVPALSYEVDDGGTTATLPLHPHGIVP